MIIYQGVLEPCLILKKYYHLGVIMGTDDLHKRNKTLRSRKAKRQENEVILIVCEGKKNRNKLFKSIKRFFQFKQCKYKYHLK